MTWLSTYAFSSGVNCVGPPVGAATGGLEGEAPSRLGSSLLRAAGTEAGQSAFKLDRGLCLSPSYTATSLAMKVSNYWLVHR